jgi:hypothetical protein
MSTKVAELYGLPTLTDPPQGWAGVAAGQHCPYLDRKCLKNRKSQPDQTIGTCSVAFGKAGTPVVICPHRLLERRQIFQDCQHLLMSHEPGNELHLVPELAIPGGSIDYCLASVKGGKPVDFVGVELQALDTTGTVWPQRQRFLRQHGLKVKTADANSGKGFGMNWKMTAKTILVQLHHKITTFEHVNRRLVLVLQDCLLAYMKREFRFDHLTGPSLGNPMHFHPYTLALTGSEYRLQLGQRFSTDRNGIARCLGLQGEAKVELTELLKQIENKLSDTTLFTLGGGTPLPAAAKPVSE